MDVTTGTLGTIGDRDSYYVRGDGGGRLTGTVSGIAGVEMRVVVLAPGMEWKGDGPPPKEARVFEGKAGTKISFDAGQWPPGTQGPILVVERKEKERRTEEQVRVRAEGLTTPYRILVQLK